MSKCNNSPNDFCVVYGEYLPSNKRKVFSDSLQSLYIDCYNISSEINMS